MKRARGEDRGSGGQRRGEGSAGRGEEWEAMLAAAAAGQRGVVGELDT